jgi:MarR family
MVNSTLPVLPCAGQQKSLFDQQLEQPSRTVPKATHPRRVFADSSPIAANRDPITSHFAAAEITASGLRASQKAELLAWLRGRNPLTSAEIAAASGFDRHGVARRLPDLAADRMIERCPVRICRQSGRPAVTWRAL